MKPISIQLYTLRELGAKDFIGVLKTVADIGYKGVELAGIPAGNSVEDVAKTIKDLGLTVSSSHSPMPNKDNIQQIVDTEQTLGNNTIISGVGPDDLKTVEQCKRVAEMFQSAAELAKAHGMRFGFHNHWWEFDTIDGKCVYDVLLEGAPDAFSELDIYWCAFGGANTVEVVGKHKSRLPYLHIKDGMLEQGNHVHTAVGKGKVDIVGTINAIDPAVTEWLIVELDACETDMVEAVRDSYAFLTSNGLAQGNK